jgi:Ca-activated chloride channel family protein
LGVAGRYRQPGPATLTLRGTVNGQAQTYTYRDLRFIDRGGDDFIPRLWAQRKIGYLLAQIRINGANNELVKEVVDLSTRYGIVTPYTSFLVTERERLTIDAAAPAAQDAIAARQVTGAGAVKAAKVTQSLKEEIQVPGAVSERILYKDDKTFYLKDGVWTDSDYRAGSPATEITFNSEAYFRLMAEKPGIAKYFSVSNKLIVVFEGVTYRIVE